MGSPYVTIDLQAAAKQARRRLQNTHHALHVFLQALVLNEFDANPNLPDAAYYIGLFGFDSVNAGQALSIELIFIGFYAALVCAILVRVNFEKR